jgi:hypothetical protein
MNTEPNQDDSYIFLLFYGCGIDVAGVVFYSEIFPNHLRAKGVALAIATIALTDLVYLQATATAFANIGWKFFLVRPQITRLAYSYTDKVDTRRSSSSYPASVPYGHGFFFLRRRVCRLRKSQRCLVTRMKS